MSQIVTIQVPNETRWKSIAKKKQINLYVLTDWHLGHENCNEYFINKVIKIIKEDSIGYWVALGDLTENALASTFAGAIFEQVYTPKHQLEIVEKNLTPIASQGLGILTGNHGFRAFKVANINPDEIIAKNLDVPYLGVCCLMKLTLHNGRDSFLIAMHHGHGGGYTKGGKINAAMKLRQLFPTADLCLTAHSHIFAISPATKWFDWHTGGYNRKSPLSKHIGYDVICGSTLEYGGYALRKLMPPAERGQAKIELISSRGDKKKEIKISEIT